jgi:hypothetical protein
MYALSNALLIFGLVLFFLGTNVTKPPAGSEHNVRIYFDRQVIFTFLTILFLLAFAALVVGFVFGGGSGTLQATRAELAAGQYGFRGVARLLSIYMFFPFLVAAPLLITQLSKPLQTVPWIVTGALLVANFWLFRARTPFVTVLASTGVSILLKNRIIFVYGQPVHKRFQSLRDYVTVAALAVCILVGGVVVTFIRGYIGVGRVQLTHGYARVWLEKSFDGGDFGYQKIQRAAYTLFPTQKPFLKGQSYYRVLLIPLPRFIAPNKPENTQRVYCSVIDPGLYVTGGTIPPGILGDLYINFGHFGLFGMFVFGMIFGRERYYRLWQWLMLAGCFTWLFHFVRGGFTNPLVTFVVYLIVAKVLDRALSPTYVAEEEMLLDETYYEPEYAGY